MQGGELSKTCLRASNRHGKPALILGGLVCVWGLIGCQVRTSPQVIYLQDLQAAPPRHPAQTQRFVVPDASALRPLYTPLGRRLGLIQVRDRSEWQQLQRAVPSLGPVPDFRRGMVVGLASPCGRPLNNVWPFSWDAVRIHDGAGLIEAQFNAGSYLPDGTTYLETAQVEGLAAVLVVSVDGVNYYP